MSQVTNGFRGILSRPWVYNLLQNMMGAKRLRDEFVQEFVRATKGCRVLDIGCGTAELLDFLPDGVSYVGYDPSDEYIKHAKKRFGIRGEFYCGYYGLEAVLKHQSFDVVVASGVLHHMDDAQVVQLMRVARDSLRNEGRLVTIDPVFHTPQSLFALFLIKMDRGQNVRTGEEYATLATQAFTNVTGLVRHRTWIPYTHWIMECRK